VWRNSRLYCLLRARGSVARYSSFAVSAEANAGDHGISRDGDISPMVSICCAHAGRHVERASRAFRSESRRASLRLRLRDDELVAIPLNGNGLDLEGAAAALAELR
jgi:hypothetical protein